MDMGAYENQHFATCQYDLDSGDNDVGITDFIALLAAWGPCPGCAADFDCDNDVGIVDFLDLLAHWGPTCGAIPEGPPQSVQDCIDRYGTEDPLLLLHCMCMFDPCEQGCPPDPTCN